MIWPALETEPLAAGSETGASIPASPPAPWPAEVAAGLDARVAEHTAIDWQPALSGTLGLR